MEQSAKDIQIMEQKDTIAQLNPAVLERVDYVATTYECPKCKDTLEPQFLKDKGTAPLIPHSYAHKSLLHILCI